MKGTEKTKGAFSRTRLPKRKARSPERAFPNYVFMLLYKRLTFTLFVILRIPPNTCIIRIRALGGDGRIIIVHIRVIVVVRIDPTVRDMRRDHRRARNQRRDVQTAPVGPSLHTVLQIVGQPTLHRDLVDLLRLGAGQLHLLSDSEPVSCTFGCAM